MDKQKTHGNNFFMMAWIIKFTIILAISVVFLQTDSVSQERYSFRLKDKSEISGYYPFHDTLKNIVVVESPDGELIRFPFKSIDSDERGLFVNVYEYTRKAPFRLTEIPFGLDTCRETSSLFLELRGIGMYADSFYLGGEVALGFRLGDLDIGIGSGYWLISEIGRIPLFLHVKYYLFKSCSNMFIYGDAGVIFDKYKISPSVKHLTEPGPKFAGIGIGFDYPLSKKLDFSIDGGMRFINLPNERKAISCDPLASRIIFTEYYMGYLRIGITF